MLTFQLDMQAFNFQKHKTADFHSNLSILGIVDWRRPRRTYEMRVRKTLTVGGNSLVLVGSPSVL